MLFIRDEMKKLGGGLEFAAQPVSVSIPDMNKRPFTYSPEPPMSVLNQMLSEVQDAQ